MSLAQLTPDQTFLIETHTPTDGDMPKHIDHKGYYISVLPVGTTRPLFHFTVACGNKQVMSFNRASYHKGVAEARQHADNHELKNGGDISAVFSDVVSQMALAGQEFTDEQFQTIREFSFKPDGAREQFVNLILELQSTLAPRMAA